MRVVECDVPSDTMLSRELVERAHFRDSFRAPLSRTDLGVTEYSWPSSRITRYG